jgi:hypothetical protein
MPKSRSRKEPEKAEFGVSQTGPPARQFMNLPTEATGNKSPSLFKPNSVLEIARNEKAYGIVRPYSDAAQREAGFELFVRGAEDPEGVFSGDYKRLGKQGFDAASKRMEKSRKPKDQKKKK